MKLIALCSAALILGGMFMSPAFATVVTTNVMPDAPPLVATASVPANRYASRFEGLAGSPQNAASLITGLRSGTAITLVSPTTATRFIIQPATRPMGHGNVVHALSLAQRWLAAQGITQPTPEQLRVALNGGTLVRIDGSGVPHAVQVAGVLPLRSQGMGWGRIAQSLSLHPGQSYAMTAQSNLDGHSGFYRHGAIVAADGAVTHRQTVHVQAIHDHANGVSVAAQTRGRSQIQTHVVQTNAPTVITGSSVFSAGIHGNSSVQVHPHGRF